MKKRLRWGSLFAATDEGLTKAEDLQRVDEDIIASVSGSPGPVTNEAWTGSEEDSDSDDTGDLKESAIRNSWDFVPG
jgi:hypothetical protein